ncbi:N-formylglutamate amidohydrolase [Cognatishimia sp. WU-CL00825]|uniref:N-formylglutamate amidohydrolase n=1 Tax=Cognatishimia sp. WU-CL00825 TaxID=3127658 RepID=UPI00310C7295
MPARAFILDRPAECTSSVVFASPHSGNDYPEWFLKRTILPGLAIRSSEDAFVDRLFDHAPEVGAPFLRAAAPRAFIDYNRSAEELDPALIAGVRKLGNNPRVASGLGVIPRVVANGQPIYRGKLRLEEAEERLNGYWRPYHLALQGLLDDARAQFGQAILIDCHSMPREALDASGGSKARRPQIVLGDRFGASADPRVINGVEAAFVNAGFVVSRNAPFAGAYVTQNYGRPSRNQHAIQVEIDRSLYMDETRITPNANFEAFRQSLRSAIADIVTLGRPLQKLAAE